jgi:hypothetical protein
LESDNDRMMRMIMQAWQQGGETRVRTLLGEAEVPAAAIDRIIAQIKQAEIDFPPQMPKEQLHLLMRNTVAVKTTAPERLADWRVQVQAFYDGTVERGEEWAIERDFAQSLLNLLDGKPAALPEKHPYASYLQEVLKAIGK